MSSPNNGLGYRGFQEPNTEGDEFNTLYFLMQSVLAKANVAMMVKVKAVTTTGGVNPAGYVDVQPMVNQVDGAGNSFPHGVVYHLPYFRLQGGTNAVILDPQVDDIGLAVICDRDISSVKATGDVANPGSRRRFSFSDGMYFGGFLGPSPTQYVRFSSAGINLESPTAINLNAPDVKITAPTMEIEASTSVTVTTPTFTVNGAIVGTSTVTATTDVVGGGISLKTHTHSGVTSGSSNTGPPA